MHYRLSKFAKNIIIINIILSIIAIGLHSYGIYQKNETEKIIQEKMAQEKVIRDTAIRMLQNEGVELKLNTEVTSYFGIFFSVVTIYLMFKYGKTNGFFYGFIGAFSGILSSFVGGFLLFYLILSGKSESQERRDSLSLKDEWEKFIHSKSEEADLPENS